MMGRLSRWASSYRRKMWLYALVSLFIGGVAGSALAYQHAVIRFNMFFLLMNTAIVALSLGVVACLLRRSHRVTGMLCTALVAAHLSLVIYELRLCLIGMLPLPEFFWDTCVYMVFVLCYAYYIHFDAPDFIVETDRDGRMVRRDVGCHACRGGKG